jgi:very-short-patch-repair endonuclease
LATRQLVERARKMRRALTPPEARLWSAVRRGQIEGLKFRRQPPVGFHIIDFYCAETKLAVEMDGQGHDRPDQMRHDAERTLWLTGQSIRVIRIAAEDVRTELDGVGAFITQVAAERSSR